MKHEKHKKLNRPNWGNWGRNEWSIVAGKCSDIQSLGKSIIQSIGYAKALYVDADHKPHDEGTSLPFDTFTDKIGFYEWA